MDWSEIKIWYILAGLGLFLFGITLLEDAIKNLAGRSFKNFLQKHTGNPIKAVIAGALTTGVMQSSSMVILLVMSFTGAGIIGLKNGIGMILGANLGTTITGWIVALLGFKINLEDFFLPVIAIGSLGMIFFNSAKIIQFGRLLLGFGLMFMGLEYMKQGFINFAQHVDLSLLTGQPMALFLLFGFLLAAAIRSSSASIMIILSSLAAGTVDLTQAGYLVIGADLGTSVTSILGTINANAIRKKTGWSQFYINVITTVLTIILFKPIFFLISKAGIHDPIVAVVTFHSSFNLLGIIFILPFINKFSELIDKYITTERKTISKYLPYTNTKEVISAIDALKDETFLFLKLAIENRHSYFVSDKNINDHQDYFTLKAYENEIFDHSLKIYENRLLATEVTEIQDLFSAIRSATLAVKDMKDIYHNMEDCKNSSHDHIYSLHKSIVENEQLFQRKISTLLGVHGDDEMTKDLQMDIENNYSMLKTILFDFYKSKQNFDLASMLNMVREIRDSENLIIKAYESFLKAKHAG
jgi:phosphate:Na+ symporter